jgi:hypothetical protein
MRSEEGQGRSRDKIAAFAGISVRTLEKVVVAPIETKIYSRFTLQRWPRKGL